MFIKERKVKLIIIIFAFLTICTVIGVYKYREFKFSTRTIEEKIDIGGYGLMVDCRGEGNPTVIFESGLGGGRYNWSVVQHEVSKITRTFSYDRMGISGSDTIEGPRSSLIQVEELHTLLKKAKVKGPYIIVAHSIGGYNARLFAANYPEEVAGIVFVDSSHEDQFVDNVTPDIKESLRMMLEQGELNYDETILSGNQVRESRKKDALRNIPIVVLTADHKSQDVGIPNETWVSYQKDLASLSDYSKNILVENCGHIMQTDNPQIIIDEIKGLIEN